MGPILFLLFGGVLLGALDIAIVGPALPAIQADLGLDPRETSAIFSVYILFGLIGAPVLASLSDRYGRRRVYIACLLLFGLGSLTVASAPSLAILLAGRAIQAFGAGGMLPVASAVIADTFPLERRGRALGLIGAVFGLAFVLGPLIGGLVLKWWTWHWLFLVNLPLVVVLIGMSMRQLEGGRVGAGGAFDRAGLILLAAGLAALAFGASGLEPDAQGSLGIGFHAALALVLAAILLALFWSVEHRAAQPIIQPALLGSKQMQIVGLLGLATGLVEASMVFLPTMAVTAFEVSASRASFMLLPLVAALIAGSILAGSVLDRIGPRPVIQVGMVCTIAGLLAFALLPLAIPGFYAAGLAVGLGLSAVLGAPLRYVALREGGESARGASQGLLTICLSSGRLVGASLTGGFSTSAAASAAVNVAGYRRAMLLVAIACGIALLVTPWLRNATKAA